MPRTVKTPVYSSMVLSGLKGQLVRAEDVQHLATSAQLPLIGGAEPIAAKLTDALENFIRAERMDAEDTAGTSARWAREIEATACKLSGLVGRLDPGDQPQPGDGSGLWPLIKNLPHASAARFELDLCRHAIAGAARNGLKVTWGGSLSDFEAMGIALASVEYLRRAAKLTAEHWDEKKGGKRTKNYAEMMLIRSVVAIYQEAFGKEPTFTRPLTGGKPRGAAIRFCQAMFGLLPVRADEVVVEGSPRDAAWRARCAVLAAETGAEALAKLITRARRAKLLPDREAN